MVAVFARAAVGFFLGLCIHVGVSPRLREPACGVAFTGAGLLPVDPVEVGILARAKQMLLCHVEPLVERCDTCLWLLSALCWLFVNSGGVFPEFFSVGSGRGEVFPRTVLCSFLVVAALPSGLSCLNSLLISLD
ncbi:hypothetical protein Taro_053421 [Colocasia esculenta]|uniref:Secreted protein n=1 Tax=Colocasia esculenta TaxID=4460 RepID=A0A843XN08_COLES|nr:hypothetical protein [Colocasia esculenta]